VSLEAGLKFHDVTGSYFASCVFPLRLAIPHGLSQLTYRKTPDHIL